MNFCRRALFNIALICAIFFGADLTAWCQEEPDQKTPKPTNELAKESSPYLLMHAHNPVNWHGWNEATLAKAKQENKPIFLSIGYSSCHWCHVMERESFLDDEIAKFLNQHFICIKVDREERPDVDEIYMNALLQVQGRGGWPLSMFLTPDARPFFGGTYWPARDGDRGATMGFLTIVQKVEEHYRLNRDLIEKDATKLTEATQKMLAGRTPAKGLPIQKSWAEDAVDYLSQSYDPVYGGFRFSPGRPNIPKFPEPSNLFFLADRYNHPIAQSNPNEPDDRREVRMMLEQTCERMMLGGIYDHVGGGFHRYSVDRYWAIPHFEKMLYDNGQLATVYAEAYAITKRDDFKRVTEGILEFVQSELTSDEGGFYSSLDAESEGEEGKFYRWKKSEIQAALEKEEYNLFSKIYRINEPPNFEKEFYAPQLKQSLAKSAKELELTENELVAKLKPIRKKLFQIRSQRTRPLLDHKILTAWNGLMIRGFADAGRILKRPEYIETAAKAADFSLKHLVTAEGRVQRTYTDGEAKLNGYLIDYSCLIDGIIAIHRATGEQRWLDAAQKLQRKQDELFLDETNGGYFYTSSDHEVLIARSKQMNDGAMPSGNSISAANLYYLGKATGDQAWTKQAKRTVLSASPVLTRSGQSLPRMLITSAEFLRSKDEK
ncbi:MAG: thioredoxin domain-containing protein [Planctomycetota bacterium]